MSGTIATGDQASTAGAVMRLSVAIPCRNEKYHIAACLGSLMAARTPGIELTVVVCDGMSEDGTRGIVMEWVARHPNIRLVDNPHRTTPHALNLGLQAVPFDFGMILGAHAEVDPEYLSICVEALRSDPALGCAGGVIINEYHDAVSRCIGSAMGHPFGVGGARFRTGGAEGDVDTVAFGIYPREVFDRVGWFDEDLVRNQDDEFSFRLIKAGHRIRLLPKARAFYHVRASYNKLFRQYFQYGYWKVYVNRKHRSVTTLRQLVPALWVSFVMIGAVLALAVPFLQRPFIMGVLAYGAASLFSAFRASGNPGDVPGVIRAFWTLHAAYGLGYLQGLVHFMLLGRGPAEKSTRSSR